MSLTIKHLNADTSFLLTFSPHPDPNPNLNSLNPPKPYTILIDPWLSGPSIIGHSWFALSHHTIPSCISHLSALPDPDLVIVSQNKRDHCHEETLRQLPRDTKAIIVAEPAAARTIQGYKHFVNHRQIVPLRKYTPGSPPGSEKKGVLRFGIPALGPEGEEGEVTVAFIKARNYATGVHNAIGITYRAPTAKRRNDESEKRKMQTVVKEIVEQERVMSPGLAMRRLSTSTRNIAARVKEIKGLRTSASTSRLAETTRETKNENEANPKSRQNETLQVPDVVLPTPPETPLSTSTFDSNPPAIFTPTTISTTTYSSLMPLEKLTEAEAQSHHPLSPRYPSRGDDERSPPQISIIYTPHGIPLNPDLQPYIKHYLSPNGFLPLTLLLHSFNRSHNPWFLGGTITAGAKGGGVEIARTVKARYWIAAHDEEKDNRGCGVKLLRTERSDVEEVRRALDRASCCGAGEKDRQKCEIRVLDVGEEVVLSGT
ncbi:predicted protein [Paecilomyces variotii No. 5]|uniref:Beta-lactamase superfamily domain-containing protein n=1 Tax=Byssochlamys spectabilis (strain No. 5 / NBRC 109023) TaxID=1356009 RepID=V5FAU6_BYSSN|nr:predicted protein [Paecilomyces variotii No. 5]